MSTYYDECFMDSEKLANLINCNPELPIIIFAKGDELSSDDDYIACDYVKTYIDEIVDTGARYFDKIEFLDSIKETIYVDYLANKNEIISEEELNKLANEELSKYTVTKAIVIMASAN